MRTTRTILAIGAGGLAAAIASGASAAPASRRYALVWNRSQGAEVCPESGSIEKQLEKLLGPISFVPREQAELVIEAVVRKEAMLRADLTLRDADARLQGERTLESADSTCGELVRSVALVAAVMIAPELQTNASLPREAPAIEPRPEPPPVVGRAEGPAAEPPSRPRAFRPIMVAPIAAVATGLLPTLATGVGLDVWYVAHQYATFGVGLRYWGPQSVDVAGKSAGADFRLFGSVVSFCPVRAEWSRLLIFGCAELDLGLLSAEGNGGAVRSAAHRPFVAPGAELRVAYWLGERWQLSAEGAVEVTLQRDQFEYRTTTGTLALFQPSLVSERAEIGVGFAW